VVEKYGINLENELYIKYVGKDKIEYIEPCYQTELNCEYAHDLSIEDECDAPFYESDEED
jgi:hypothetical protein